MIENLSGKADSILYDLGPHVPADSPPRLPVSHFVTVEGRNIENQTLLGDLLDARLNLKEVFAVVDENMGKTVGLKLGGGDCVDPRTGSSSSVAWFRLCAQDYGIFVPLVLQNDIDVPVFEVDVIEHVDKSAGRDLAEGHTLFGVCRVVEKQEIIHAAVRLPFLNDIVRISRK